MIHRIAHLAGPDHALRIVIEMMGRDIGKTAGQSAELIRIATANGVEVIDEVMSFPVIVGVDPASDRHDFVLLNRDGVTIRLPDDERTIMKARSYNDLTEHEKRAWQRGNTRRYGRRGFIPSKLAPVPADDDAHLARAAAKRARRANKKGGPDGPPEA